MTYHIFVSGRVQGVGYRRFAQKCAQSMSLIGWTRNLLDGRVEVIASGSEQQLQDYCEQLKRGPMFAQVRDLVVKPVDEKILQQDFQILADAEMDEMNTNGYE